VESIVFKIALIGGLGIGAQWIAWRFRLPSVVLLALAGILIGPVTGILEPQADFGDLFQPAIAIAVAIILFEGGLTLNFREIRQTSVAIRRVILIGAPLGWALSTAAAHYVAGLPWETATIFGGILVVTGPTVIMPLLRNARLKPRVASVLRWEGIINDPIGAIFAVFAYEVFVATHERSDSLLILELFGLAFSSAAIGVAVGFAIVQSFRRGWVPEFLKSPLLLAAVLLSYEAANSFLDEGGLLAVTAMGLVIGNSRLSSLDEIRRFKEYMSVLLVSAVFILLTATITADTLTLLDWRSLAFLAVLLIVVRPVTVFLTTLGSGLSLQERGFVAWIAPRGVVAVAVSGLFGATLAAQGYAGGDQLVALTFLVVFATILLHGFSLPFVARRLDLISAEQPGVLLIGASPWATAFAGKLAELEVPVMIADASWNRLGRARMAGIRTYRGDILSEAAEHTIDLNEFEYMLAVTDDDAYNALILADFGPELGRSHVLTLKPAQEKKGVGYTPAFRGEAILDNVDFWEVVDRARAGWTFVAPKLGEERGLDDIVTGHGGNFIPVLLRRQNGRIAFFTDNQKPKSEPGDVVIGFGMATPSPTERKHGRQETAQTGAEPAE
jgi:NhaP-type Na+/H+ or K+/H+ antiporter